MSRTYRYKGELRPSDLLSDHEQKVLAKRLSDLAMGNDDLFQELIGEAPLKASFRRTIRRTTSRDFDVTLGDSDA